MNLGSAVENVLDKYILHPSKMRKQDLKDCATTINKMFQSVAETEFLSFSFLSRDDPFERKLRSLAETKLTSIEAIVLTGRTCTTWFNLLQSKEVFAALSHLFQGDFASTLLPSEMMETYMKDKRSSRCGSSQATDRNSRCCLAENVYRFHLVRQNPNRWKEEPHKTTPASHAKAFMAAESVLSTLLSTLDEYTIFIRDKYPNEQFSRRDWAIHFAHEDFSALPFLLKKDFEGLDRHHDDKFDSVYKMWIR